MNIPESQFIPTTCEREIAPNIVFRPIRSWHSNTYAGEGLYKVNGDGSGCLKRSGHALEVCYKPYTVTHRAYWHKQTGEYISAFLSYPSGMGAVDQYFWEIHDSSDDYEARFFSETEMETVITARLTRRA